MAEIPTSNKEKIELAISYLKRVAEDTGVPRNARNACKMAIEILNDEKVPSLAVRAANAISKLDEIIHEPIIPTFARTFMWKAISILEQVKD